jgi:hypothetical protein
MGRHGWKGTTAGYRQIDVRWMQLKGYLRPGMQSSQIAAKFRKRGTVWGTVKLKIPLSN